MLQTIKMIGIGLLIIIFFIGMGHVLAETFNKHFNKPKEKTPILSIIAIHIRNEGSDGMKHKKCDEEIVLWVNDKGEQWHPFFIGYCPECDIAVRPNEVKTWGPLIKKNHQQ